MSLTRKFIRDAAKEAGIESLAKEFEDAIINEHVASRDAAIEKATEPLNEQLEAAKSEDKGDGFKEKYEKLFKEHEALKTDILTKETNAKKQAAVKSLIAEIGISEKRHDLVMKSLSGDLSKIELDADGKIKDVDALKTEITTDWGEFIETTEKKASQTPTPPATTKVNDKEAEVLARVRSAMGLPPEQKE